MAVLGSNFIRRTTGTGFFPAIDIKNSNGTRSGALCRAHITFSQSQFAQPPDYGPGNYYNVAGDVNATSFNVNIIENIAVGVYAVRFTNFMPNDEYTVIMNAQHSRDIGTGNRIFFHLRGKSPGEVIVETIGGNGETGTFTVQDADLIVFTES
jgi:hypothetical protein